MHTLTHAALVDPVTPAPALAAIAATNGYDVTGHLLAHPNTPEHALTGRPLTGAHEIRAAFDSPALTETTRTRLLAATPTVALRTLVFYETNPQFTRELVARFTTTSDPDMANALFNHPYVPAPVQVHALHVAARAAAASHDTARQHQFVLAATHHPAHLRTLADLTTGFAHGTNLNLRTMLLAAADAANRGSDPTQNLLRTARTRLAAGDAPDDVIRSFPDPDLALEVYTAHTDAAIHLALATTPALLTSPVWRLALLALASHAQPDPTIELPLDPGLAAAQHASEWTWRVSQSSYLPVHADPVRVHAAAHVARRLAPTTAQDSHLELSRHVARVLLHPTTRDDDRDDLRTIGHTLVTALGKSAHRTGLTLAMTLTADGPDHISDHIATLPLPALHAPDGFDKPTYAQLLAHHTAPLLRHVWQEADLTRTVLALAPTYPGTIPELVQTARTITT